MEALDGWTAGVGVSRIPHPPAESRVEGSRCKVRRLRTISSNEKVYHVPHPPADARADGSQCNVRRLCNIASKENVYHVPHPPADARADGSQSNVRRLCNITSKENICSPGTLRLVRLPALAYHEDLVTKIPKHEKPSVDEERNICDAVAPWVTSNEIGVVHPVVAMHEEEIMKKDGTLCCPQLLKRKSDISTQNTNTSAKSSSIQNGDSANPKNHKNSQKSFQTSRKYNLNAQSLLGPNSASENVFPSIQEPVKCKMLALADEFGKEKCINHSLENCESKGKVRSKKVLEKIFKNEKYCRNIIEDVLFELIERIVTDLGHLPFSMPYFVAGHRHYFPHVPISELNVVSCVKILKHESKSEIRNTAEITVENILRKVCSVMILELQKKESSVERHSSNSKMPPCEMSLKLSSLHGHHESGVQLISVVSPDFRNVNLKDEPFQPFMNKNVHSISAAGELMQQVLDKLKLFVSGRLQLMAAPRSQTQSSTGHKCESSVSCNSRSEVLPTGNLLSCGLGQYHSDSMTSVKEKIVSKLNFTNPLLVLPSFVSSKQFKKIVERIYVSTSVLELYAKSVLTDILKVTEKEFQQEDVTSVPGSDASAGIICSLIEGLHSENKDSFYSNEEIKPLDLFNLPRCHSYLGSLSSAAAKMQKAAELHPTHQNMDDQRDFPLDTDPVRFCVIHAEHNNDNMQVPTKNIVKSNRGGDSQVITINGKSNIYARKAKATMQMPSEAGTHIKPGYASNALNRSAVKKSTPEQILVFPQKNNVQIDSENRSVVGFNHIKMSKGDLTITSDNISQPLPSPFGDSKVTEAIDKNLGLQVQGKRAEYDTSVNTFMDNFDNNLGKATNTLVSFAHHSPLAVISDGILNVTKERPSELVTSKGPDPSTECLPEENHLSGLPMIVTRKNEVINTLNSGSQNNSKHAAELKLATEQCCMSNGGTKPVLHFRDSNPSQSTNTILATEVPSLTKNKSAISYSPRSDIDVLNESIANDLIKGTFQTISESAEQSQDDAVYSIRSNQLPHSSNSSSSELTHEEVEGRPCNAFRNKLGKSTPSRNLSNKVSEKITTKPLETCLSTINVESNNSSCGDEGWQTSSTDTRSCKPEEVLDKNKRVKEMQIYHNSNAKQTTLQGNKSITSESSFTSSDFNFTADSMTNIKCGQNMNDLCLEEITESLINSLNDIFQNFQETKCAPHAHARDSDSALPEQSATHIAEAPNSPSLRNTEGTLKPTLLVDMPKATQIALQEKDNHAETENSNQFKQKNIYCSCFPLQRMGDGAGKDIVKQDQMESNVFPETFVKLAVVEVKNKIFNNDTDKRNIFQENFEFYNSFLGSICEDAVKLVFHEISNHMNNGKSKTCTNQKTEEHLLKGDFHSCTSEALSINMNHICHGALLMTISEKNIHDIRLSVMNFLSEKTIDTLKEQQNNLDIKWLAGEIVGIATETLTGFYEDVSLPSKLPQCFKKAGISKSCQNRSTNLCVGPLTVVKKCHSEEHNILSVIKENKEFKQLEDLSISKHIVKHVNCSPLLTLKTNSPVPPPMAEDVSGAYDNSRGTSTEDSTRDPDCDDESSGSSVYQSQTIFLEDERFTGTKLGDIVIQLANTIFPSTTSSSPNTDGEVMHMERNALSLANLLLKELKEEFWNSIDTKFEQFVYSRTDVEKVVQSVYNKYSKELEFPDALQNELKKDNALIVHNLANAIILELVYKRPGSVVSLDPCCLEEYSVFEEFCDEEVARASLCGNESGYKVYSVSLLENIICKVLCRILTTSDVLAYDINNNQKEDNYCEIMVKLMCSVQMYLKTQRVLIVKVNEKMALPTIGDSVIQNVAISVYHRVFEEYGSHMDIYVNLTEGNQLFAELFTYFILQEMSKLDLECDVFEGVEKIPQATIDTSFVTQTILNNISEVKKHNETSIKCFLATLLNILIPQIASQIWLQFQSNGIHSEGQNSILEEDVSVRQRQMVKHKLLAAHQHRRSSSDP